MAIVLDGTTNTVTPLNGALGATTPSTVVATTVVASSTIKGATTIAVGNATPSASGAGITFPATQSASTDANTLDDYEEGTFTPVMQGMSSSGTGVYAIQSGFYTKIGRVVTFTLTIEWTSHTGTGNIRLNGLPFTVVNTSMAYPVFSTLPYNISLSAGHLMAAMADTNATYIYLQQVPTGGGVYSYIPMDTAGQIILSGTYYTA